MKWCAIMWWRLCDERTNQKSSLETFDFFLRTDYCWIVDSNDLMNKAEFELIWLVLQQSIFYEILMNNLLTNHLWSESIKFYLMNEQCWYGCYAIGNIVLCCQPKHLSSEEYSAFRLRSVKIRSLSKLSICCRSQTRSRKSNCLIVFSDILKTQLNASERLQIATLLT